MKGCIWSFDKSHPQLPAGEAGCSRELMGWHYTLQLVTSEVVVKPADKPINYNNKHIQTMFLIIRPEEELYTQQTPCG